MRDAHCHLADLRFSEDLDAVISRSRAAGVTSWIQGGVEPADWDRQLEIRARYGNGVIPSFGLHPLWVSTQTRETVQASLDLLKSRIVEARALGELGLDQGYEAHDLQAWAFEEQLKLARLVEKPLILHIVRMHGRALELLKAHGPYPRGGIVHLFSGPLEMAREYLKLGFVISVGGSVTRPGFRHLKEALPALSPSGLVVETDAPDQLPEGVGSQRNEPGNLPLIADAVAAYLGVSGRELLTSSTRTLERIFGPDDPDSDPDEDDEE